MTKDRKKDKHILDAQFDIDLILLDLQSPDVGVRAKAVRSLCPCRVGATVFEQNLDVVDRLRKDSSPEVRANALHVFEDAMEMESEGLPTNPREATNEMLRTKRASRFRPDEEAAAAKPGKVGRSQKNFRR